MLSVNDCRALKRPFVLALAFTPCVCIGQTASIQAGVTTPQDGQQLERLAMRVVRGDFTKRGVTDFTTVGLDPNMDASLKPLHTRRSVAHVKDLVADLGGRSFSRDSVGPNSFYCRLTGLTKLVYLSTPTILRDSATIRILYNIKDQYSACRFFDESKTLSFARRGAAWVYTGIQGGVTSS